MLSAFRKLWRLVRGDPGPTQGAIGPCTSTYVAGWAGRDGKPPPPLTVLVNGQTVGTVTPWLPRPDATLASGLPLARGFFLSFPVPLAPGDRVEVAYARGKTLYGSPFIYEIAALPTDKGFTETRAAVAAMFLRGAGLEIGAFTQPTDLPPGARAEYYDRYPAETLRGFYDEACGRPLVEPNYHGEAQSLEGLPPGKTFDFIIANHVIEHLEDPIAFLENLSGALNTAGRVLLVAPNKRFTFDELRGLTPFEHLVDDHLGGFERNREAHYLDWVAEIDGLSGDAAQAKIKDLMEANFSIHFHVWNETSFVAFVTRAVEAFQIPLTLLFTLHAHTEITVVLERATSAGKGRDP